MQPQLYTGNQITGKMAYHFADLIAVYPITPSTGASQMCDTLFSKQELNYDKKLPIYYNSNSELSSIALCHGGSYSGSMPTTFTSSQGLLLMIPSIIKMKGERRPVVVNIATRALGTHTLSTDNDNSDLQQLINSGAVTFFASNQQECQFNTILSFLVAKQLKTPVLNCYDGGIISDETQLVKNITQEQIKQIDDIYKNIQLNIKENGQIGLITSQETNMSLTVAQKLQNQQDAQVIQQLRDQLNKILKTDYKANYIVKNQNQFNQKQIKTLYISNGCAADYINSNLERDEANLVINQLTPNDIQIPNAKRIIIVEKNINPYTKSLLTSVLKNQIPKNVETIYAGIGGTKLNMNEIRKGKQFVGIKAIQEKQQKQKYIGKIVAISQKQIKQQNYFKNNKLSLQIYSTGSQGWSVASDQMIKQFVLHYNNISKLSWHDAKKSGGLVINQLQGSQNQLRSHQLEKSDIIFVSDQNTLNQVENKVFDQIKKNGTLLLNSNLSLSPKALQIIKKKHINIFIYNQQDIENIVKSKKINFLMGEQIIKFIQGEQSVFKPCNQLVNVNYNVKQNQIPSIQDVWDFALDPQQENGTAENNYKISQDQQIIIDNKCINCGKCVIQCPHGALQNVILSENEAKKLNIQKTKKNQININGKTYIRQIFVDKDHCTNCKVCISACPTNNISLKENDNQQKYDEVKKIIQSKDYIKRVKGVKYNQEQYKQQPLKGHGACAGCGQIGYYSLLQRIQPSMDIVQSTGCPLVYLGQYNCSPLNKQTFWMNSLFEDANEVGLGVQLAKLGKGKNNRPTVIIQGDGAAYDIDYNGLDQNLRSNVNVTMLVLDNQCYANTGGQKSGSTPQGVQAKLGSLTQNKFTNNVKELPLLALTYQNVYIATVTMNDTKRTERILKRAMEFNGPSLVLCYSPCVNHKRQGYFNYLQAEKQAVDSGAFILMEYDPEKSQGQKFSIDSKISIKAKDIKEERIKDYEKLQQQIDNKQKIYQAVQKMVNSL